MAATHLLSAIIDATSRSDDKADHHRGVIAEQAAYLAMLVAGATQDEAKGVIDECVAMHERGVRILTRMVEQDKSD